MNLSKTLLTILLSSASLALIAQTGGTTPRAGAGLEIAPTALSPVYETLSFLGRIVPERSERHMSDINGYIQRVYVSAGARVKKGEPLFSVLSEKEVGRKTYRPQIVTARLDGVIASSDIKEGAFVRAFTEAMEIAGEETWLVKTFASDKDLSRLRIGQAVSLYIDKDLKGEAKVAEVGFLVDSTTKLFPVSFSLKPSPDLYLGALVRVDYSIMKGESIIVPRSSLIRRFNSAYMWRVTQQSGDESEFILVPVILGDLYENQQIILTGLEIGDFYARNAGNSTLRENIPLKTRLYQETP